MSDERVLYIAGMGMVTPVGANVEMTAAAVKAGISGYAESEYTTNNNSTVTMAGVPEEFLNSFTGEIDEGEYFSEMYDHIIKMMVVAARESFSGTLMSKKVPVLLVLPEPNENIKLISSSLLSRNLLSYKDLPVQKQQIRTLHSGRAAGIEAIELGKRYLYEADENFVLIGGSDSYWHFPLIRYLSKDDRVLTSVGYGGFVPGEASGFLLLTKDRGNAMEVENNIIALQNPGLSQEVGHMYSREVNKGEGLDLAFKQALASNPMGQIDKVYSSMNGEQFWAKEFGVAIIRNKQWFKEDFQIEHPSDCYGDVGAATGPVLIGLAATDLLKNKNAESYLVHCSSDGESRAAIVLKKEEAHGV